MKKSNSSVYREMKKYLMLIISIITIVGLLFLTKYLIGEKLEISYVTSYEHTPEDLAAEGFLNEFEWFIIRSDGQRENIEIRNRQHCPLPRLRPLLVCDGAGHRRQRRALLLSLCPVTSETSTCGRAAR